MRKCKEETKAYKFKWDRDNRDHNRIYKNELRRKKRLARMMKAGTL